MSFFDEITGTDGVAVLVLTGGAQAAPGAGERAADPDRDVLELVARGELDGALRCVMKRHGDSVLRYCREALRDPTLAEDVRQQVFIHVHRALPKFRGDARVRTWLFSIARNRVLDAAKARRRASARSGAMPSSVADDLVDPAPSPGLRIDDRRLTEALVASMDDLDEAARDAVVLRYPLGFTYEEMAEVCREKAGTLAARVSRAMPVLRAGIEARLGRSLDDDG
jgi:RNA polymerase sigma-70 factor, ECF subfamily